MGWVKPLTVILQGAALGFFVCGFFPLHCRHLEVREMLHEVHTAPPHLLPVADPGVHSAFRGHMHKLQPC